MGRLRPSRAAPLVVCMLLLAGCNEGADVREWLPSDHDGEAKAGQVDGVAAPGQENAVVLNIAYKENCARCHGLDGAGNTPEGRMNKAPNLAQTKLSDAQIANVIAKGRNKMPAFGKALSPDTIEGLVAKVRSFGRGPKK